MSRSIWVLIFTILGLIALSVIVWLVPPLLGFDDLVIQLSIIGGMWLLAGLIWLIRVLRRRKKNKKLEENVVGTADETPVLREKMQDAMATLKRTSSRGGSAYLYDLPWYIIIGPPGSGKTTALVNSGLKFPLAGPGGAEAIAGTGGTRHCDWWFTEEAVLIDTAGKYTTQDNVQETDTTSKSWLGFLEMLAENRPRQPINGVLICISVEDLMTQSEAEKQAHAAAIRQRLDELHKRLNITFPVYMVLTKMDLVAGFMDYFGDLTDSQRAIVWGTTFKPKDRTDNMVANFPEEYDKLMLALSAQLSDRMATAPDPQERSRAFGFPTQMASLKDTINSFLVQVFEPTRYHVDAALRGVYFTSGTQEGTPIDRVLGALSRNFGAQGAPAVMFSGKGKSFFLTDLLQKVVFEEAGWVSTNLKHIRRAFLFKTASYVALFAVTIGLGGLWGYSYLQNSSLQSQVEKSINNYREKAVNLINEVKIGDGDLHTVLDPLDSLRRMPLGYASIGEDVPFTQGLGLGQHERLQDANVSAYRDALDRLFTPRLIYRLEEQLKKNMNNTAIVYEGLKVYLMLGGQAKMDEDLVKAWMSRDWQRLYPGAANAKGRERLMEHLEAALERPSSAVPLNGPLVQQAQRALARMPVSDRAYTLMKTAAESAKYEKWIASERGGPDADLVFETRDGAPLDQVVIPGFFTYAGFHEGFLGQIEPMVERARNERWVLGNVGEQSAIEAQFRTIRQDLMDHYRRDFVAEWDQQLSRLKIASVGGGSDLTVMSALAAPTSPLKQLLQSVSKETMLTKVEGGGGDGDVAGADAADREGKKALKKALQPLGAVGRVAGAAAADALDAQGGDAAVINYGERVEAHFKQIHEFAGTAGEGAAPVDNLIARFNNLYQAMNEMQAGGAAKERGAQKMQQELQAMQAEMPRMPAMIADMAEAAAGELNGLTLGSLKSQLNQSLGDEVLQQCLSVVENNYPFYAGASREVTIGDFTRLFSGGGIMNKFFESKLAGMVDRSGKVWRWRGETALSRQLSNQALRQFQYADEIRQAFFPAGGAEVNFTITPETLSANATSVTFDFDGQKVNYAHGAPRPTRMRWPGPGGGRIEVSVTPELSGETNRISQTSDWSLFRTVSKHGSRLGGNTVAVSFQIGGREAIFTLKADSSISPFALPALSQFRCPRGL